MTAGSFVCSNESNLLTMKQTDYSDFTLEV